MNKNILIYGRDNCIWCDRAVALLETKGLDYTLIKINPQTGENLNEFFEMTNNAKSVPQIFINGKLIGGYDKLSEYFENESGGFGDDFS